MNSVKPRCQKALGLMPLVSGLRGRIASILCVALLRLPATAVVPSAGPVQQSQAEPAQPESTDSTCPPRLQKASLKQEDIEAVRVYADTLSLSDGAALMTAAKTCIATRIRKEFDKGSSKLETLTSYLAYLNWVPTYDAACPVRLKTASISLADIQALQTYAGAPPRTPAEKTALLTSARTCVTARLNDSVSDKLPDVDTLERDLGYLNLILSEKDPRAFHASFYGATTYSNLYRDATKDSGFFSTSKPSLLIELSQIFTDNLRWDTYGNIGLGTKTAVTGSDLTSAITAGGNFVSLAGIHWWLKQPNYAWILVGLNAGAGIVGVPAVASSGNAVPNDHFNTTYEAGVTFKQASGAFAESYSQFGYLRDPQFQQHPNRVTAKVRFVYTPQTLVALANASASTLTAVANVSASTASKDTLSSGLGGFIEGLVNLGSGPEEARITIGLKLNLDAIWQAIFGTNTAGAQTPVKTADSSHPAN
jgi:hypothetical protein